MMLIIRFFPGGGCLGAPWLCKLALSKYRKSGGNLGYVLLDSF